MTKTMKKTEEVDPVVRVRQLEELIRKFKAYDEERKLYYEKVIQQNLELKEALDLNLVEEIRKLQGINKSLFGENKALRHTIKSLRESNSELVSKYIQLQKK